MQGIGVKGANANMRATIDAADFRPQFQALKGSKVRHGGTTKENTSVAFGKKCMEQRPGTTKMAGIRNRSTRLYSAAGSMRRTSAIQQRMSDKLFTQRCLIGAKTEAAFAE